MAHFGTFLRTAQVVPDDFGLSGREAFRHGAIARLQQFRVERLAVLYPSHESPGGIARVALGEVHEGDFLLRVRSYDKVHKRVVFCVLRFVLYPIRRIFFNPLIF